MLASEQRLIRAPAQGLQLHLGEQQSVGGRQGRRGHSLHPREWPGSDAGATALTPEWGVRKPHPQQGPQNSQLSMGLCLSLTTEADAGNDRVCRADFVGVADFIQDTGISLRAYFFRTKPIYLQNCKNSLKANLDLSTELYRRCDSIDVNICN